MPKRKAVHAELYSPDAADNPVLNGGKCRACGYVFFPPQRYGCESCGALPEKLEAAELRGRGRLHSYATVHLHQGKDIVPIPGTKRRAYLEENVAAAKLKLDAAQTTQLDSAMRPENISGPRYAEKIMATIDR